MQKHIKVILERFKSDLKQLYGKDLVGLILYGSYSRGEEREDSDIDVLVILQAMQSPFSEIRRMSDLKYNILEKYEKVISTVPTTQDRFDKMEVPLYKIIKKEGIRI